MPPPPPPSKPKKNTSHYLELMGSEGEETRSKASKACSPRHTGDHLVQRNTHSDIEVTKVPVQPQKRLTKNEETTNKKNVGTLPARAALTNPDHRSPTGKRSPALLGFSYVYCTFSA